jgi:hypothetical protein
MPKKFELKISDLRLICDPKIFKFKNTSEVKRHWIPLSGRSAPLKPLILAST